jgi:hypothetical protein
MAGGDVSRKIPFLSVFAGCKQFLLRNYVERLLED